MPTKINFKDKVNDNVCDLSLSELEEIPIKDISLFKRVTVLDLSLNRLVNLGDHFSTLNRLVKLDLSKNQIKYLPEDFGLLRQLRYLDLFGNQLENLPLTFGDLSNLRYLDLHNNPLNAALSKIVGPCLTNRECQESAKRTVNFMSLMQLEVVKAKKHYMQAMLQSQGTTNNDNKPSTETSNSTTEQIIIKSKKSNKKSKSKKKSNSDLNQQHYHQGATPPGDALIITKANKTKRLANGSQRISSHKHNNHNNHINSPNYSAALSSLITFILLLVVNIFLIYMIMFKNPQIAEKLVETIPHQYRDWIISKTEIFRLRVTDWISEFRTPPEEH